jgi:hypothetical protein
MPGSVFKIIVDSGDWGSPMTNEATFDNLEDGRPPEGQAQRQDAVVDGVRLKGKCPANLAA